MANLFSQKSTDQTYTQFQWSGSRPSAVLVVLMCIAAAGVTVIGFFAQSTALLPLDLPITQALQTIHAGWFAQFMDFISEPGFPPQVWLLSALIVIILFVSGMRLAAAAELAGLFSIGAIATVIKDLVNRARPDPALVHVVRPDLNSGRLSFPAGHVVSYVTMFGFLLLLSFHMPASWRRIIERFCFSALILLIGISRIYQGEHWASDVLAGYLLGFIGLILTIWLYHWLQIRFGDHTKESSSPSP